MDNTVGGVSLVIAIRITDGRICIGYSDESVKEYDLKTGNLLRHMKKEDFDDLNGRLVAGGLLDCL